MLNKVEARTAQGGLFTLSLINPDLGFKVRNVEGLDPVKANIVSSSQALLDAEVFQSSRREKRQIKIKMGVEPDWVLTTVEDLREQLYNYFMPKTEVLLSFYRTGKPALNIVGIVEEFDMPLFTADPEATITLLCLDSDFIDPTPVVVNGNTVSTNATQTINYSGNIETGIVFTMNVNRTMSGFTLYNTLVDDTLRQLTFAYALLAGDVVTISTVPGNKYVRVTRGGVTTDILYAMSPTSNWLQFFKGDNRFRAYATGAAVPFTIAYTKRYGGL